MGFSRAFTNILTLLTSNGQISDSEGLRSPPDRGRVCRVEMEEEEKEEEEEEKKNTI